MCGLTGWIDDMTGAAGQQTLECMNDAIAHRGPDGAGTFMAGTRDNRHSVALGHRRLAIIDLATGQQPMASEDGGAVLVFNGEIYNFQTLRDELKAEGHSFRTHSDTEVILKAYQAWGLQCVKRLRGMFAFALWDGRAERLLLARDHFGKKPLYLYQDGGRLLFGSEIKSLLAHPAVPRQLDRQSVLDYLTFRYVPGPHTLFKGIRKLRPGTYALWEGGRLQERIFFTPPDAYVQPDEPSLPDPVERFADKLDECVAIRMVSDVPFGAFLSGGLDSSAVVALMSRHSSLPVNTFSVGFAEAHYSELRFARQVAQTFKTNHHELEINALDIMDQLPKLIFHRDAPVAEPADIPVYLLSAEAAKSVKMVLTGEGSDEILAGYPKHKYERFAAHYQRLVPEAVDRRLVQPLVGALPYRFRRIKTAAAAMGQRDPQIRMARWFGALSPDQRDRLSDLKVLPRALDQRPFNSAPMQSPLRRICLFDQASWLPDNLLERGDRMTMAASIEARMPFMDVELAHLVARLPDSVRIRDGQQKWILRRAVEAKLPFDILHRPKNGFRVPVAEWFQGPMRSYLCDHLLGPDSLTRGFYDRAELTRLLDDHARGRRNHEKAIWMLLGLELFQREYRLG